MTDAIVTTNHQPDVDLFLLRFPSELRPAYRRLLYYAAMPLVITPELLHYLRSTFVRDAPWVAEADLLLASNLFEEKNFEQYIMPPAVRDHLLRSAREQLGAQNLQDAARLLVHYLYHHLPQLGLPAGELNTQSWAALLYLDEYHDKVIAQIIQAMQSLLDTSATADDYAGRATLEAMIEVINQIAPLLIDHPELVELARMTQSILHKELDPTTLPPAQLSQTHEIAGVQLPSLAKILGIRHDTMSVNTSKISEEVVPLEGETRSSTVDEISERAMYLTDTGVDAAQIGEIDKAHHCFQDALELWRLIGNKGGEADTLKAQGDAYRIEGHAEEALAFYEQVLDLYRALGDRGGEAVVLNEIAGVYGELDKPFAAMTFYEQALAIYQQIGDKPGIDTVADAISKINAILYKTKDNFDYDVFISYSSQDKDWVRNELLTRLEAAGLTVFIDFRDFQIGAPTITEMKRGMFTSRKTLLVLTPAYLASQWTEFENLMRQTLDSANRAQRLHPLLKEPCELPIRIGYLTYFDFTDPTEHRHAWPRLIAALRSTTAVSTTIPESSPSPAALRQLRTILVNLYPDKRSARRVADDAGLAVALIDGGATAVDTWHAILREAQRQSRLDALLEVVSAEYGGNREWAATIQDYFPTQSDILSSGGLIKILFLASNPLDMARLAFDVEMREIARALQKTSFHDQFKMLQYGNARYSDLRKLLLLHQPNIIHFSNQGIEGNGLIFEDASGNNIQVNSNTLSSLFHRVKEHIHCIVLSACYTQELATHLVEVVGCVIGSSRDISDKASIQFTTAFYTALGFKSSIRQAYNLALGQLALLNIDYKDAFHLLERNEGAADYVLVVETADFDKDINFL